MQRTTHAAVFAAVLLASSSALAQAARPTARAATRATTDTTDAAAHRPRALAANVPSVTTQRAPRPPCLGPTVEVRRAHDDRVAWRGPLAGCDGRPALHALAALSALASPSRFDALPALDPIVREIRRVAPAVNWSLTDERPARRATTTAASCPPGREPVPASTPRSAHTPRARALRCRAVVVERDPHTHDPRLELAHRVRVLHPRLVAMLAQVAAHFPGRTIEVVSGYRPSRDPDAGSRHAHARALDFRVVGVSREALRDFARTLPDAGVGYYPNSVFVHMDVRDPGEGPARWTDYAGPGEHARYGHWPPRDSDVQREITFVMGEAERALAQAGEHEAEGVAPPAAGDDHTATTAPDAPEGNPTGAACDGCDSR